VVIWPPESPAAFAPLREVGALLTDGGVVAVAGVEPGVVGELGEDAFGDVVLERGEVLGRRGPADAAGEASITLVVNMSRSSTG
jgi:hypothetical protein